MSFTLVGSFLKWKVGNEERVRSCLDPWVEGKDVYRLSQGLRIALSIKGCHIVVDIYESNIWNQWISRWKSKVYLILERRWEK